MKTLKGGWEKSQGTAEPYPEYRFAAGRFSVFISHSGDDDDSRGYWLFSLWDDNGGKDKDGRRVLDSVWLDLTYTTPRNARRGAVRFMDRLAWAWVDFRPPQIMYSY